MTPRYEWTPASEPPDTDRLVLAWTPSLQAPYWAEARHVSGKWFWRGVQWLTGTVTHWRDVDPPGAE